MTKLSQIISEEPSKGLDISEVSNLIRIPQTYQETGYTCGVAVTQSILNYYGKEAKQSDLEKVMKPDPKAGLDPEVIISTLRASGVAAELKTTISMSELQSFIDSKIPVIVMIQAWPDKKIDWADDWKDGHYAITIGYDKTNIYLMDPSTLGHYAFIPLNEFMDRWHDTRGETKLVYAGIVAYGKKTYNPDMALKLD